MNELLDDTIKGLETLIEIGKIYQITKQAMIDEFCEILDNLPIIIAEASQDYIEFKIAIPLYELY